MIHKRSPMQRILAVVLSILMLVVMLPATAAAASETYIGITSDVHGAIGNLSDWLSHNGGSTLKQMVFGGDLDTYWSPASVTNIGDAVGTYNIEQSCHIIPIFTMGNHDWMGGSEHDFTEATKIVVGGDGYARTGIQNTPSADGYTIYTLGAYDMTLGNDFNLQSYSDASKVSDYAKQAFKWACGSGLIQGTSPNILAPKDTATRAEVAKLFMLFMTIMKK